jgi:hypothetical protein
MSYFYIGQKGKEEIEKLKRYSVCAECGGILWPYYDIQKNELFLACKDNFEHGDKSHEGITRKYEHRELNIPTRREQLEKEHGSRITTALDKYAGAGQLTKEQAKDIITTIWPNAPQIEVYKAINICVQYGLNPLMKHLFLIPFNQGKQNESWVVVLGIQASRLIAHRAGNFSYIDDTPRLMSEDEQKRILGEVDTANIWAITKLKDSQGNAAQGYGNWPKGKDPYGSDKGNTKVNMAFIRSERNAFDRLFAGKMPLDIEVMDEAYADTSVGRVAVGTGEIIEGECREVQPEQQSEATQSPDQEEHHSPIDMERLVAEEKAKAEKKKAPRDPSAIKDTTALQKALYADFKLQPKEQLAELNITAWSELNITPAEAYTKIAAVRE